MHFRKLYEFTKGLILFSEIRTCLVITYSATPFLDVYDIKRSMKESCSLLKKLSLIMSIHGSVCVASCTCYCDYQLIPRLSAFVCLCQFPRKKKCHNTRMGLLKTMGMIGMCSISMSSNPGQAGRGAYCAQ